MGVRLGAAALVLAIGVRWGSGAGFQGPDPRLTPLHEQKTTRDRIYSKEQAARGGTLYVQYCEKCHTPEKVPEGKKPGPPVKGDKFIELWADRPLAELYGSIINTMPNDGSAVLTSDQTLDIVAHILQLNGFPDGPAALKNDEVLKSAVIVK